MTELATAIPHDPPRLEQYGSEFRLAVAKPQGRRSAFGACLPCKGLTNDLLLLVRPPGAHFLPLTVLSQEPPCTVESCCTSGCSIRGFFSCRHIQVAHRKNPLLILMAARHKPMPVFISGQSVTHIIPVSFPPDFLVLSPKSHFGSCTCTSSTSPAVQRCKHTYLAHQVDKLFVS